MRVRHLTTLFIFVALGYWCAAATEVQAAPGKSKEKMIFHLAKVEIPSHAPAGLEDLIRAKFNSLVTKQPTLLPVIPKDAPAIDKKDTNRRGNKPFRKYMKKKRLRPYRVTLQVTEGDVTAEDNPKAPGTIVSANIRVHIFGETLPFRTMAFTGDGSAKVAIQCGKKVREKDKKFAMEDAAEFAIDQAIAASLEKLKVKRKAPRK